MTRSRSETVEAAIWPPATWRGGQFAMVYQLPDGRQEAGNAFPKRSDATAMAKIMAMGGEFKPVYLLRIRRVK